MAKVGDVIGGRFRLERRIGSGGLSTIFAAANVWGEKVAIKVLRPEFHSEIPAVERFMAEAYLASRVDHPSAVRVHEACGRTLEPYLVMELLSGETLDAKVARAKPSLWELLTGADQVLDVLGLAHARGVVHRDIKPSNLFVTSSGRVKVLDFGVALLIGDTSPRLKTTLGTALGSLPYMSPEQALGRRAEIDGRADLFSLGATLFRAISGRPIRRGANICDLLMVAATEPIPSLGSVLGAARGLGAGRRRALVRQTGALAECRRDAASVACGVASRRRQRSVAGRRRAAHGPNGISQKRMKSRPAVPRRR
jgi:serine/threonine-protein kinase